MPEPILFTAGESGERLDAFLRDAMPDYSRSALQKLIEEGNVLLNGRPAAKNARLKAGDALSVALPPPAERFCPRTSLWTSSMRTGICWW